MWLMNYSVKTINVIVVHFTGKINLDCTVDYETIFPITISCFEYKLNILLGETTNNLLYSSGPSPLSSSTSRSPDLVPPSLP